MTDIGRVAARLEKEMRAAGSKERAEQAKRYLKSDLRFLGTSMPAIRKVIKGFSQDEADLTRDELIALVEELWSKPIFERRIGAVVLLEGRTELLKLKDLEVIERLIRESKTWALVDGLAVNVLGRFYLRDPRVGRTLRKWATDADFWVRRSSLIAYIRPLKEGRPSDEFARNADLMLEEKEFFIRKAIGWTLREMSKSRPAEVRAWIEPRAERASGVTLREARKYL
ncbi:MAG TPA: DNA alkylation repair protein [Actinomycetota bacterium]|nr:DNA alkylation repair protein [Actinomycetota bacterium]